MFPFCYAQPAQKGNPPIKTESERQSWNFSTLLWHSAPSSWCWWASSDSASPPKKVAPVALIWTLVLAFTYFNITGAINEVKGAIARISDDRRVQVVIVGMMNLLASDIAAVVGKFYPAAAVLIGASGSFITGTGLGSNIMFADMHIQAAGALGMNPITVFAGQNAGASLGNLICPNNTVAACATVDQIGNENKVMKRTLPAFAIILGVCMVLTMLYTCVLFPHFGM